MFKLIHRLLFVLILGCAAVAPSYAGVLDCYPQDARPISYAPGGSQTFRWGADATAMRSFILKAPPSGNFRLTVADSAGGIWCDEASQGREYVVCDLGYEVRQSVEVTVTNLGDSREAVMLVTA